MIDFNKNIVVSVLLYAMLVLVSIFAGLTNEQAGYILFFSASFFFSAMVVYEVWRESKPMKEISHQVEGAAQNQKELSTAVHGALFGKASPTYVLDLIRQIIVKKLSLRLDVTEVEAESLLQNPEKLRSLGYEKLAFFISEKNFLSKTKSERMKVLDAVLRLLEED
ncbi:MAG: hypothetical protein QW270_04335 [Candidatus Bathyarchaeia archaeon]